jgi:hypothetical protein
MGRIRQGIFFPTSIMKTILSSLKLVKKIGVCITSEENGESKLTNEENLFNNLGAREYIMYYRVILKVVQIF